MKNKLVFFILVYFGLLQISCNSNLDTPINPANTQMDSPPHFFDLSLNLSLENSSTALKSSGVERYNLMLEDQAGHNLILRINHFTESSQVGVWTNLMGEAHYVGNLFYNSPSQSIASLGYCIRPNDIVCGFDYFDHQFHCSRYCGSYTVVSVTSQQMLPLNLNLISNSSSWIEYQLGGFQIATLGTQNQASTVVSNTWHENDSFLIPAVVAQSPDRIDTPISNWELTSDELTTLSLMRDNVDTGRSAQTRFTSEPSLRRAISLVGSERVPLFIPFESLDETTKTQARESIQIFFSVQ